MLSLLPFADPFLLPDALGFLHPLPFLGQTLLLQAGDALGRRIQINTSRRLAQSIG